ncbi:MAG: FAD-dependent oxidoreductase, partial [Dehalococcoidia bacterium]|jgi:NADPH-dependent glutamate synthase beta subunit-like oxidoreductase/coenzyme F420-reducing hydrogenase delta subunit/ferredoxin|nr:FAD-dependent oxidoreductase [Dehalococcoidia bacterium]
MVLTNQNTVMPPCQATCPIHQDIRGYLAAIATGDFRRSLALVMETNPLPSICATICSHPCENECRRGHADKPLSIRALKRVAIENGGPLVPPAGAAATGQSVAVIGSGPAGLTAAHDLAVMGHRVTVFEKEDAPGGAVMNYIPLYRLPRDLASRDIASIQALGVDIQTGKALGKDLTIDGLKQQGYQAVVLGLGLPLSRGLNIPGADSEDVLLTLPFLKAINHEGYRLPADRTVIVIGGGNVAIDTARSALRAGAKAIKMVCLESHDEMPAYPWEIEEAAEEGIEMNCSWGPKQIIAQNGRVSVLECKAVKSVFDDQGRFNPTFHEDRCTLIGGDIVILAIGQASDVSWLPQQGVSLNERGQLTYDPNTMATEKEGVFACGEVVTGPGSAVRSMSQGRKAALAVDAYLRGEQFAFEEPASLPQLDEGVKSHVKTVDRNAVPAIEVDRRIGCFDLVDLGYTADTGIKEARRCLNCGNGAQLIEDKCVACLTCVRVCPYGVPVAGEAGKIDIRVDQCQACGICVGECPANAISFRMAGVEDIPKRLEAALAGGKKEAVFFCAYNSHYLGGADTTGMVGIPCLGKIDVQHILKAAALGAERVFLVGCSDDDCPYQKTMVWAQRRADTARNILREAGLGHVLVEMLDLETQQFGSLPQHLVQAAQQAVQSEEKK